MADVSRRGFLFGLASLATLAACGTGDDPAGGTGEKAAVQELTMGISNLPTSLDPMAVLGGNPRRYDIFDALFDLDPGKATILPMLATAWEQVSPTSLKITLRTDAKFHNGAPMTSADVVFSLKRAATSTLATASLMTSMADVTAGDASTVTVTMKSADALFLKKLARVAILPEQYFTGLGADEKTRAAAFADKPIGTGPYKLASHDTTQWVLTKFDDGWRKGTLTKVTIRSMTDAASQVAAFTSGQVQYINLVPLAQLAAIKSGGGNVVTYTGGNNLGAFLDTVDYSGNPKSGPMGKKEVRQALNYAIDKQTLIKNVLQGQTEGGNGQLATPGAVGYDESLQDYPYDAAKAESLLDAAGYPKGPDGTRFTITMASAFASPGSVRRLIGEYVQNQLGKVGVKVQYTAMTDTTLQTDMFYARKARADIFHYGLFTRPYLEPLGAFAWFIGSSATRHYSNPEFDALYKQALTELDDAKRGALSKQLAQIMHDDAPFLFLTQDVWIDAGSKKLAGMIKSEVETDQYLDKLYLTA
nr:ABC transporter substrate-binding protein [Dactylosporangium thailandense]